MSGKAASRSQGASPLLGKMTHLADCAHSTAFLEELNIIAFANARCTEGWHGVDSQYPVEQSGRPADTRVAQGGCSC
jgi:hypothetical protein